MSQPTSIRLALLLPALLLAVPAFAQPAPDAAPPPSGLPAPALHITGSGEFVVARDVGQRDPAARDGDTVVMVEDPHIVRRTNRVEARLCQRFGFMFTMENMPPGSSLDVAVTSVHPPILLPSGRISTGMTYDMAVSGDQPGLVGFSFDDSWELVPGAWSFTVRLGDQVLAEQSYDVTPSPDPARAGLGRCSAAVS